MLNQGIDSLRLYNIVDISNLKCLWILKPNVLHTKKKLETARNRFFDSSKFYIDYHEKMSKYSHSTADSENFIYVQSCLVICLKMYPKSKKKIQK